MPSSFFRSPSQSTTHGSYVHDSDQDAHDYTRLRLQQQLAKDLLETGADSFASQQDRTDTIGIMEGAAAMSTRRLDDILPSTPNLDSKYINAQFKDFSTIGVGVRTRLFPHLSNNPDSESLEIGRGGDEHTKTDRSTVSVLPKGNKGRLNVPNAGVRRNGFSPNTRARLQPTVADDSMEMDTRPLNNAASRLQAGARRSRDEMKGAKDENTKDSLLRATSSTPPLPKQTTRVSSAFLNTEKLFKDMGFASDDNSGFSEEPQPSAAFRRRVASKPYAPSYATMNSIKLPDMTGISSLVSGVNQGDSTMAKKAQHVPIESIPVPHDERELMGALKKLQEKVAALEADKAKEKKKNQRLEKDYEETRNLYQIEYNGRRELEAELNTRKRADSALGGEISSQDGSPRSGSEKEKLKAQHKAEIKKLDGVVTAYRHRLATLEKSQTALNDEITKITEEKNASITSLAQALAKNESLVAENNALHEENEELRMENETLASEIENMNGVVDEFKQALKHERKLMNDKVNRYREKVARAGRVATEATLGANEAMRLYKDMKTATASKPISKPSGQENIEPVSRRRQPSQQVKPAVKVTKTREHREEITSNAEERVQQQVDAELRKMFTQTSSAPTTKGKAVASVSATVRHTSSNKPHVKKTRTVVEEYSESESDHAVEEQPAENVDASIELHMDTTFTEPSLAGSRIRRESDSDVLPDDTLHSFLTSEGMACLRKEIRNERRAFEEGLALQRELEESDARKNQVLAERAAHQTEAEETAAKKRVFIYSEKDNETTITDADEEEEEEEEEETPHPHLRTSMIVNDPTEDVNINEAPAEMPSRPQTRQNTVREQDATLHRTTHDAYNEHVQEVINQLGVHKPELCTICHRNDAIDQCNTNGHSGNILNETLVDIPEVIPVSQRQTEIEEAQLADAGDMTIRPSQPPKYALDKVVKQMEDELEHMKLDYKRLEEEFLACDPSLGRRKRKSLTHALNDMVEQMDKKSDQIYSLYDVAELVHAPSEDERSAVGTRRSRSRRASGGERLRSRRREAGGVAI